MVYFMPMKHNHAEAFAVMRYASKDGSVTEKLWNSRDGVTPFTLMSKDDRVEMQRGWTAATPTSSWWTRSSSRSYRRRRPRF